MLAKILKKGICILTSFCILLHFTSIITYALLWSYECTPMGILYGFQNFHRTHLSCGWSPLTKKNGAIFIVTWFYTLLYKYLKEKLINFLVIYSALYNMLLKAQCSFNLSEYVIISNYFPVNNEFSNFSPVLCMLRHSLQIPEVSCLFTLHL